MKRIFDYFFRKYLLKNTYMLGLSYILNIKKKHLNTNVKKFKSKLDIRGYKADISETKNKIKWQPKKNFKQIIYKMVNDELF